MGKIDLFENYSYSIGQKNKTKKQKQMKQKQKKEKINSYETTTQKCKYYWTMNVIS